MESFVETSRVRKVSRNYVIKIQLSPLLPMMKEKMIQVSTVVGLNKGSLEDSSVFLVCCTREPVVGSA